MHTNFPLSYLTFRYFDYLDHGAYTAAAQLRVTIDAIVLTRAAHGIYEPQIPTHGMLVEAAEDEWLHRYNAGLMKVAAIMAEAA